MFNIFNIFFIMFLRFISIGNKLYIFTDKQLKLFMPFDFCIRQIVMNYIYFVSCTALEMIMKVRCYYNIVSIYKLHHSNSIISIPLQFDCTANFIIFNIHFCITSRDFKTDFNVPPHAMVP